jgi:hypothetical protein
MRITNADRRAAVIEHEDFDVSSISMIDDTGTDRKAPSSGRTRSHREACIISVGDLDVHTRTQQCIITSIDHVVISSEQVVTSRSRVRTGRKLTAVLDEEFDRSS